MSLIKNEMKNIWRGVLLLIIFVLLYSGYEYILKIPSIDVQDAQEEMQGASVVIEGKEFKASMLSTPLQRQEGLSETETLEENTGALFLFNESGKHGIWMKEMDFPIDILWMDENFFVVGAVENASPESFPEIFYPDSPALYVFETHADFLDDVESLIGKKLEISLIK